MQNYVKRSQPFVPGWLPLAVAASCGVAVAPALAQTSAPEEAAWQFEMLALAPTLRLTNVGWDDNVFFVSSDENPIRDFTATLSPAAQAWVRLPRVRLVSASEVDFVYYKQLSSIRSIDTDNRARVEAMLGRLTPYGGGTWTNARHRRNFEIDAPIRRVHSTWDAGVDVALSSKTSVGVMARGSHEQYEGDTLYDGSDLAEVLDASGRAEGVRIRYKLTPYTSIGADVQQDRARFAASPERDSDGNRVSAVVEFDPKALVSGRAELGLRKRRFLDGNAPAFQGAVARVDLAYTLLGRTRFGVAAQRDLTYSYRIDQRDYLQAGVELSVTHRLGSLWDVRGRAGRHVLTYGLDGDSVAFTLPGIAIRERVNNYSVGAGVRLGSARVGFEVSHQRRASDFGNRRGYERTRIASSLEYGF